MNCVGLLLTYEVFTSCLNIDNHQPIWVSYTQPFNPSSYNGSRHFKRDNKNELKSSDYTNSGYDRGHLCPDNDYGEKTYYMSNVVPMTPNFNRGQWKVSEKYIRDKYKGYTIYKGCNYSNIWKDKLQIPVSCWYRIYKDNILIGEKTIPMIDLKNDRIGIVDLSLFQKIHIALLITSLVIFVFHCLFY